MARGDPDDEECREGKDVTRITEPKTADWREQPTKPQGRKE
jgi:hypothetical protein